MTTTNSIALDDYVQINNIKGIVEHIGYDIVILRDCEEKYHEVKITDIKEVYLFNKTHQGKVFCKIDWRERKKNLLNEEINKIVI